MTTEPIRGARSRRDGFTLIEVLIAMVILAIGLLALEAMAIGSARMIARADRQGEFTSVAAMELETTLAAFRQNQNPASAAPRTVGRTSVTRIVTTFGPIGIQGGGTITGITVEVRAEPAAGQNHLSFQPVTVVGRATR